MKKVVKREISFCDVCDEEASGYTKCEKCGKEFCYDCRKVHAIEFPHAVHASGSGDGLFCHDCHEYLSRSPTPRYTALLRIRSLRKEEEGWYEDFRRRCKEADAEIVKTLPRREGR